MTRVNNLNYTVAGENFQRGTATTDQFQTGDVQLLALAVENHQHQNTRGLPVMRVNSGSFAGRPAAGNAGHVYVSTDQNRFSFDNGTAWQDAVVQNVATVAGVIVGAGGIQITNGNLGFGAAPLSDRVIHAGSTTLVSASTSQYGAVIQPIASSSSTVEVYGVYAGLFTAAAAYTVPTAASIRATSPINGAGSTITNAYGILVDSVGNGSAHNYGVYINQPAGTAPMGLVLSGNGNHAQIGGFLFLLNGSGSAAQATIGAIRMPAGQGTIGVRNFLNTADITMGFDGNDAFALSNIAIAAGGSGGTLSGNTGAGGATGAPASLQVNHWLTFNRNGTLFKIPVFL